MDFLSDNCILSPITDDLRNSLARFVCAKALNIESFFRNEAIDYANEMMGQSYAFVEKETKDIVCAFCVTCASISTDEMPKSFRNKMNRRIPYVKQRNTYPAILLAQLAINDLYKELHLGDKVMRLIKAWIVRYASQIAGRYLIVDAVNTPKVIEFYQRNNFKLVFETETDEQSYSEITDNKPLETRFMITDLIDIKHNLS